MGSYHLEMMRQMSKQYPASDTKPTPDGNVLVKGVTTPMR